MNRRAAWRLRYALVALGVVMGCTEATDVASPGPTPGRVSGTVTLLGTAQPDMSAGHVSLYASLADFETRRVSYDGTLTPVETQARTFSFVLDVVRPGTYYVTACFAFGCGEYRDPERGQLIPVLVPARSTTRLDLSF